MLLSTFLLPKCSGGLICWRVGIIVHKCTSHSSHSRPFFRWFDIGIRFIDLGVLYLRSIEMHRQQTYRGSSFYIGGRRGLLVYDNSLFRQFVESPSNFKGESHVMTTLIIPITACYYLTLHKATTIYPESDILPSRVIYVPWCPSNLFALSLVKFELTSKMLLHCVTPNGNTHRLNQSSFHVDGHHVQLIFLLSEFPSITIKKKPILHISTGPFHKTLSQ